LQNIKLFAVELIQQTIAFLSFRTTKPS